MERREPPATEEGWYALHDLRRVDWDAWRVASESDRQRALAEGVAYLRAHEDLEDTAEGGSAVFSVLGHKADLLLFHMRPATADLDLAERRFEQTALAQYTKRASSYVSVTEISGYTTDALQEGSIEDVEDQGLRRYLESRLYPEIPDAAHVCFYPMDKRRGPDHNWYDLPFEERADLMSAHGEIGREYAGQVTQIITGSVGMDDHEWGVTLFADDPTQIKHLLYEMRFDPSSSRYAEFGPFYFGRRLPPEDLAALLAGEPVPTGGHDERTVEADTRAAEAGDSGGVEPGTETEGGESTQHDGEEAASADRRPDPDDAGHEAVEQTTIERELRGLGIDPDEHAEAGYCLVFRSSADAEALVEEVDGLRGNFEHYDTHVLTTVRAEAGESAVVSLWTSQRAADIASGFLADIAGSNRGLGGPLGTTGDASADRESTTEEDAEAAGSPAATAEGDEVESIREQLADLGVYAGRPHGEDVYAIVLYSEADPAQLTDALGELRERFEHIDSHVTTAVYESDDGPAAVVSLWETPDAAEKAGGFLADLPGVVGRADDREGFATMGMFYTVQPGHREDFRDRFAEVDNLLADMEGHLETQLLEHRDDENDMFIASRWRSKADALEFFRSDEFRETVQWGREVLADRPRHVFLT